MPGVNVAITSHMLASLDDTKQHLTGALIFRASDASAYVTGQTLLVDGGISVNDTRALPSQAKTNGPTNRATAPAPTA